MSFDALSITLLAELPEAVRETAKVIVGSNELRGYVDTPSGLIFLTDNGRLSLLPKKSDGTYEDMHSGLCTSTMIKHGSMTWTGDRLIVSNAEQFVLIKFGTALGRDNALVLDTDICRVTDGSVVARK